MGQAKLGNPPVDKIEIEPAEKRLAEELKRALELSRAGMATRRSAKRWLVSSHGARRKSKRRLVRGETPSPMTCTVRG